MASLIIFMTSIESGARTTSLVRTELELIAITHLARRAVAIDEGDAEAHACLSWALNFNGRLRRRAERGAAGAADQPQPGERPPGDGDDADLLRPATRWRAALEVSIRLDPGDPLLDWHLNRIAIAH